ncbi:helix-turn-helix transcriptional regulator [Chitinibacter bivalviorum]|uniref:Helix-turn-helix transcriptional regulator n=1 Tax=Chitinibacter bivalviorum TaxID=2739434 RepID=A0A7H9BKT4_9NEIS|nr:AraC family transcriptional regulator [Chitinibacter bivalviorum]QLG89287.1 helix-turn-helix transcriptional regulator [Chitinibacter bivalviorum]
MSQVQTRQIQQSVILAKATQQLREVTCLQATLMRIVHGEKHIWMNEQTHIARRGDLLIAPAGMQLTLSNHPDAHGYACEVLALDATLIQHFRSSYPEAIQAVMQNPPRLCEKITPMIEHLWDEVFAATASHEPAQLLQHRAEGLLLAMTMAGYGVSFLLNRSDSLAERVQHLIMLHPAQDWTVDAMAKQLNLGASTLRRQLDKEGQSFRDLLEQVRLNMALGLIQTSKQAIGQIALQCGYASASRFSARFQQQFGVKPMQLRATVM